jgi:hypothetical protein
MSDMRKTIFKTFKNNPNMSEDNSQMKKMMRLMKNRLSARKCRQKKKVYINALEKEICEMQLKLEKYQNIEKKEKQNENIFKIVFLC